MTTQVTIKVTDNEKAMIKEQAAKLDRGNVTAYIVRIVREDKMREGKR